MIILLKNWCNDLNTENIKYRLKISELGIEVSTNELFLTFNITA